MVASPIAWSNDDLPELGGDTPLEACLRDLQDLGFDGVELGNKFPREPQALRQALAPYGQRLVSGWYSLNLLTQSAEAEITAAKDHMDLLKALGSDIAIVAETSNAIHGNQTVAMSQSPKLTKEEWPLFTARMNTLADHLSKQGMRLAYHHHMGTVIETEDDIVRFCVKPMIMLV